MRRASIGAARRGVKSAPALALLPALLLAPLLAAGCAAVPDPALLQAADRELLRRPGDYRNGEARAWTVSRDGVPRGLLWGTVHVGYEGATVMPRAIRARFAAAADLTVESVIDRLSPEEDRRLRDVFRRAEFTADPSALARLDGRTRDALDRMVPPALARSYSLRGLANAVAAEALGKQPGTPELGTADFRLVVFARNDGKPVLGLETPQLPDPTLSDPNGPEAAALLRHYLRRADTFRAMSAWSLSRYAAGDVARTVAILVAWRSDAEDLARNDRARPAELSSRTAAWVAPLETILSAPGEHFVAVGAAHLLGTDGLVALLRARGWRVEPCVGDVCG